MRTSRLNLLVLVLAVLASSSALAATVWKWVDKSGVTHYSDQPVPGAVQVDLLNVQTYDADEATIPAANRPTKTTAKAAAATYQSIQISSPVNEHTFTGTGGQVSVSVQVNPALQSGDSVHLTMDGQAVSTPNSVATSFALKDVSRGAHTLVASVLSRDGQTLIQSTTVTFFIQQTSVQNRQNKKR
jgi:Domain of unknown function (DUF4124)